MEIRLVKQNEVELLEKFIDEWWKKDHVLSRNRKLLNYQHFNGKDYNFVVAIEDGKIYCALGFIPTRQYDPEIERFDIWLAIWCKTDDCPKGLGSKLLDWIEETLKPDTIGAIGINDNIEQLYLKRGWTSGVLKHYYFQPVGSARWEPVAHEYEDTKYNTIPQKSSDYVFNRYQTYPFYKYYSIYIQGAELIVRIIEGDGLRLARIVDIIGEIPNKAQVQLQDICDDFGVDLIDCTTNQDLTGMGMLLKPDNLIIPNWVEPVVWEHKPIKYAYKAPFKVCGGECFSNYVIFKGDSDQDRINI